MENLVTPKRGKESKHGRTSWYSYYAGFSSSFVENALCLEPRDAATKVLDPWNGSGTTSQVAFKAGYHALGYDLNPVMVVVAKARTIDSGVSPSIRSILDELLEKALQFEPRFDSEPLGAWLEAPGANSFRRIERAIYCLLISRDDQGNIANLSDLASVSSLASFFYVALFRVLRDVLIPFRSSNPTWMKVASQELRKVVISRQEVFAAFRDAVLRMEKDLGADIYFPRLSAENPTLNLASSNRLPVESESVDIVITSPPYCTRIDYVIKTAPELALLGATAPMVRDLRNRMIGTPTISPRLPESNAQWGKTCLGVLNSVSSHKSKAARSYYWKTYLQYFAGMNLSIQEIDRTLRPNGKCLLVVQDSYFKDVHVDLAKIMTEFAGQNNWRPIGHTSFISARTMAGLNTAAKAYGKPTLPTESVLAFAKRP